MDFRDWPSTWRFLLFWVFGKMRGREFLLEEMYFVVMVNYGILIEELVVHVLQRLLRKLF